MNNQYILHFITYFSTQKTLQSDYMHINTNLEPQQYANKIEDK